MRSLRKDDIVQMLKLVELKRARHAFVKSILEFTDIELREVYRELSEIKSNTVRKQVIVARSFGLTDSDELESKLNNMMFLVQKYQGSRLRHVNNNRSLANDLLIDFVISLENEECSIYDKEVQ